MLVGGLGWGARSVRVERVRLLSLQAEVAFFVAAGSAAGYYRCGAASQLDACARSSPRSRQARRLRRVAPLDMMRCVVVALLLQSALGFRAGAPGATLSTPPASVARRASDGFSLDEMNNPAELAKQLKAEMEEAKAKGDTDRVITLMGTLLSMEGGYEFEGGAGGSSKEGRCAD